MLVAACMAVHAQNGSFRPFAEFQSGVMIHNRSVQATYGALAGVKSGNWDVGIRYRVSNLSPLHEVEPLHEVSLLLQHSVEVAPRLELYGGVSTGFALEHGRQGMSVAGIKELKFGAEATLGMRYHLSETVTLTFNVGVGTRMSGDDWRSLAKQLPYDPRTQPLYATAAGGVGIGFAPTAKRLNLPQQLIVDGSAPMLDPRR